MKQDACMLAGACADLAFKKGVPKIGDAKEACQLTWGSWMRTCRRWRLTMVSALGQVGCTRTIMGRYPLMYWNWWVGFVQHGMQAAAHSRSRGPFPFKPHELCAPLCTQLNLATQTSNKRLGRLQHTCNGPLWPQEYPLINLFLLLTPVLW